MLARTVSSLRLTQRTLSNHAHPRMYVSDSNGQGVNQGIVEMLASHREAEQQQPSFVRNQYRIRAFQTAIDTIQQIGEPIQSMKQLKGLKGIGAGIESRISLYLDEHFGVRTPPDPPPPAPKAKAPKIRPPRAPVCLRDLPGIGPTKANALVSAGCKSTLDLELPKYQAMLTKSQKIKFKYHKSLAQPVTRQDSKAIIGFIKKCLPEYDAALAGGYRRGNDTSSSIDIVLFHPEVPLFPPAPSPLQQFKLPTRGRIPIYTSLVDKMSRLRSHVVQPLIKRNFIVDTIRRGGYKWQGIVRLLPRRRTPDNVETFAIADIHLLPAKSRGAAMIALTGDNEFSVDMSYRAMALGWLLDEFGLWRWQEDKDPDAPHVGHWELINATTEEEIFAQLGMDYVEPTKRNFSFVMARRKASRRSSPTGGKG